MDKQILSEYNDLFLKSYSQNYTGLFFHPEASRDSKLNESLLNIKTDIATIDSLLTSTGTSVDNLLISTTNRLNEVKKIIISEKERLQDIQMLCNKYIDFDNVNTLENLSFKGSFTEDSGAYMAAQKKTQKVNLKILDVQGNGYEGNKYVYNNYEYQQNTYDTSIRDNLVDSKISTYYEYSRITIQDIQEETNTYFNKDTDYAKCTISFEASDLVNYINISTEDLGIEVIGVQYSFDGIKYQSLNLSNKISINNKLDSYSNYGYVYGSGIIYIPSCYYFKITFITTKNKDDVIAYEKTIFENTDDIPSVLTSTYIVPSAKRSSIKINDISGYKKIYQSKTKIQSNELLSMDCYSIGVFANVYLPYGLDGDAIEFILTINGVDYTVVPINSHSNGIKIIRFSGGKSSNIYTQLIGEKIHSAYLTIIYNNAADVSPVVNNIKILIGGEI
jgi:hypothetical protein